LSHKIKLSVVQRFHIATNICTHTNMHLSVCTHETTRKYLNKFLWNLILGSVQNINRCIPIFIRQNEQVLYMKTYLCLWIFFGVKNISRKLQRKIIHKFYVHASFPQVLRFVKLLKSNLLITMAARSKA
jgi:hypothetical protein